MEADGILDRILWIEGAGAGWMGEEPDVGGDRVAAAPMGQGEEF